MDWNKTKTIFIFTFLILNVFLGYQLYQKKTENTVDVMEHLSIEKRLQAMNIRYDEDLQKQVEKDSYMSGDSQLFTKNELKKLTDQKIEFKEEGTIVSKLDKPVPFSKQNARDELKHFVSKNVVKGEDYAFAEYDERGRTSTFFETYNGKPIFNNKKGRLSLTINDKGEITGYEQSYLYISTQGTKKELLPPLKVLERLLENNDLPSDCKVEKIELGYYSLPELSGDVQVLAPTWQVSIKKKNQPQSDIIFINAVDGEILNK